MQYHGHTVTWRRYVSAGGGQPLAGIGDTLYYQDRLITAMIRPLPGMLTQVEHQTMGGQVAAGQYQLTTREALGRRDLIVWGGTTFRCNGPAVQTFLHSGYITVIERGDA